MYLISKLFECLEYKMLCVNVGMHLIFEQEDASTEDEEEEDVEEEEDEREEPEEMCEKSNVPQNGGTSEDKRRGTFS